MKGVADDHRDLIIQHSCPATCQGRLREITTGREHAVSVGRSSVSDLAAFLRRPPPVRLETDTKPHLSAHVYDVSTFSFSFSLPSHNGPPISNAYSLGTHLLIEPCGSNHLRYWTSMLRHPVQPSRNRCFQDSAHPVPDKGTTKIPDQGVIGLDT